MLFQIILEKAKITLFAFSPHSGELHAGKVKPRHFDKGVLLNMPRRGKLRLLRPKGGQWGFLPLTAFRRQQPAEERVNCVSSKEIVRTKASHLLRHADAQKSEGVL